jgi:hypothetical protein
MNVVLAVLAPAAATETAEPEELPDDLDAQLQAWHRRSGTGSLPSITLHRAITVWTRLHGLLSLELDGHLASTGIDPALLYQAETQILAAGLT